MGQERVPTGLGELDSLIEGGLQRGSLCLLAGPPGSGKTVFAARFICKGVAMGEAGVYVSFSEDRETFVRNISRHLGVECEECLQSRKCVFLDLVTVKEKAVSTVLGMIVENVLRAKAKRLVIDSYSAMAQAFEEPIDARIVLHTVFEKLIRQLGCTTILIAEVPHGEERMGTGIEEFVADGVIRLKRGYFDGCLLRELEIMKLKGTRLQESRLVSTLHRGFGAFLPFEVKPVRRRRRFKPIPDLSGKFSMGSRDLDRLLDGGYSRGSAVLLEVGEHVSTVQYSLILNPTAWNFYTNGRGLVVIPSLAVDYNTVIRDDLQAGFTEDEIDRLVRVCVCGRTEAPKRPCIVGLEGKNLEIDNARYIEVSEELRSETGQPILFITGLDSLISHYGRDSILGLPLSRNLTRVREKGDLSITVLKPGYDEASKTLGALADVHLRLTKKHGAILMYGIKPRTGLHVVEMDVSKGYPMPRLTPVV